MAKGTSAIQMFSIATQDAAASIDMQDDGFIEGVLLQITTNSLGADGDGGKVEISFGSTNSFTTNDARQVIGRLEHTVSVLTAASTTGSSARQWFDFGEGLPFFGGERIYLHTLNVSTGAIVNVSALLVVNFKGGPVSRRR